MVELMFVFLLGLAVGSFLNVCIYRLPRGGSLVSPPSRCGACGARLKPRDLVPVLSYLALGGRCRHCGAAFPARYAAVELMTGLLFVWCRVAAGPGLATAKALVLTAFLVVIAFIDYDHRIIPDRLLLWLAGAGAAINLAGRADWPDALAGALSGGGVMLLIAVFSRGGLGGGDVKFAAALGLWLGWQQTLLALLLAFVVGGLAGGLLVLAGIKGRRDFIPFGPFMAGGAFAGLLYGGPLLGWYLGRFP